MPVSMEILLKLPKNEKIHRSMGSILQGVLMEIVDEETANKLHENGLHPYNQYIFFNKKEQSPIWHINTLTDWAYEKILIPLINQKQIFLRHKNYHINLMEHKIIKNESYEDIADDFMNRDINVIPHSIDLNFLTTTSFRRDGQYVIFPELYLIIQSLLNKWNTFSTSFNIEEENLSHILAEFCQVKKYHLYTQIFLLEHQKVNGFCGNIKLNFNGNEMVNRLLGLLFHYSNYSGIGIKTALGMGAVKVIV